MFFLTTMVYDIKNIRSLLEQTDPSSEKGIMMISFVSSKAFRSNSPLTVITIFFHPPSFHLLPLYHFPYVSDDIVFLREARAHHLSHFLHILRDHRQRHLVTASSLTEILHETLEKRHLAHRETPLLLRGVVTHWQLRSISCEAIGYDTDRPGSAPPLAAVDNSPPVPATSAGCRAAPPPLASFHHSSDPRGRRTPSSA